MAVTKVKKEADVELETPKPTGKFQVMLGNGCKRYSLGSQLFEAGVKYNVSKETRERLFKCEDDNGVRYFYDAEFVERQLKATLQRQRKNRIPMEVSPQQFVNVMTDVMAEQERDSVDAGGDSGEVDTAGDSVNV